MPNPKMVMIVDDESLVGLNVKKLLESRGYAAVSATSGETCLRLIDQGQVPDLILMDINLGPGRLSGPETTQRLHSRMDIPVVLHSAYSDEETINNTRTMTKYGYVHKVPGNDQYILATIDMAFRLLERERMYRDLSAHINNIREEQNAFLAREIHDDLGQSIAALKMNLTMLQRTQSGQGRKDGRDDERDTIISDMREILDATALKVRSLIYELRPSVLDTPDMVEALRWHTREFSRTFGVPVDFESTFPALNLGEDKSLTLFRIAQEALTNAVKHGAPSRINVTLTGDAERVVVTVIDDGCGFPVKESSRASEAGSFGILGMKERAERWDGSVRIESAPGKGTRVVAALAP